MPTIERKPLPPLNSKVTAITEADRSEIVACANDVVDYYLNGAGSYFDSGTQKPLVGELGENTVDDLTKFRDLVIASKQFADDPHSIMQSVVDLIGRTIEKVERAAQNNEGRDGILLPLPDTNDSIHSPKITGNPAQPVSLRTKEKQSPPPSEAERPLGIFSGKPMPLWPTAPPIFGPRDDSDAAKEQGWFATLGGLRDAGKSQVFAIGAGAPAVPLGSVRQKSFGNGNGAASRSGNPNDAFALLTSAPQNPQGPLSLMDAYLQYRKQLNADPSQAPAPDASAPAATLVPSDDSGLSGGLLGRVAALMDVDPQNPDQPAPAQDDDLRALYRSPVQQRSRQRLR